MYIAPEIVFLPVVTAIPFPYSLVLLAWFTLSSGMLSLALRRSSKSCDIRHTHWVRQAYWLQSGALLQKDRSPI